MNSRAIREARLTHTDGTKVSTKIYNLIIGGVLIYGLAINYILCLFGETISMRLSQINPLLLLLPYLGLCFLGSWISRKSTNPFVSFLGYNLICLPLGILVSSMVYRFGGVNSEPVKIAFLVTLGITLIMCISATAFPQLFEKLGKALFIALIISLIVGIISIFIVGLYFIYSILCAALFSLYIGYDFYRSQQFPKTVDNAVNSAIDIYVDVINLFIALLRIFGRK